MQREGSFVLNDLNYILNVHCIRCLMISCVLAVRFKGIMRKFANRVRPICKFSKGPNCKIFIESDLHVKSFIVREWRMESIHGGGIPYELK